MSDEQANLRTWQISIRGILLFTTGIALSICLIRLAFITELPDVFLFLFGLTCLGGSIGGLVGRLSFGSRQATVRGIYVGGALAILFPFCAPAAPALLAALTGLWLIGTRHKE